MKDMLGKSGFDVIGDVHGHAAELTILFKRMGYQETNGVLRHPEGRRVVFLGDFIDRGPEIRRTLEIVRGMVEAGSALAAWMETKMRRLWEEPTDSGELRFTGPFEAPVLTQAGLVDFGRRKDPVSGKPALGWKYKEKFLTGPEKGLPAGVSYLDKEGCERTSIRVKWWMDPAPDATLGDMIMAGRRAVAGLGDAVSVPLRGLKFKKPWTPCPVEALTFVGHYWLDEDEAGPLTDKLACLDCSVARGGALCAYRHESGRRTLDPEAFLTVPALPD